MRPFVLPAVLVSFAFASPGIAQTKYAVVVGVNRYDDKKLGDLNYAEADARALADALRKAGFTVIPLLGKEATKVAIQAAVDGVLKTATKDDTLLFAFAGHGQQFTPKGEKEDVPFLCPPECDALQSATLVRLNDLLVRSGDAKVGKALFLVDACRNDPVVARGGVNGNAVNVKAQTVVLFAAANGQKAREHKDAGGPGVGRGLFMSEVIDAIAGKAKNDDGEVTWDGLVARVKSGVKKKSRTLFPNIEDNQHQSPIQAGSLDNVVLSSPGKPNDTPQNPPKPVASPTGKGKEPPKLDKIDPAKLLPKKK